MGGKRLSKHYHTCIAYTLFLQDLIPCKALFTMAKQCPICPKQFDSKAALKGHTGTADPTVRKPHVCPKCDKTFCSKRAMEQHRDAPSHKSMFSCDVCKKQFGSKPAVAQHQKSLSHERILAGAKLARGSAMDAVTNTGNVRCLLSLQSREEDYSMAYITCRLHLPETSLIYLHYLWFPSQTIRIVAAIQTKNLTVMKVPGQTILAWAGTMNRTGYFATRTADGADTVQMALTTEIVDEGRRSKTKDRVGVGVGQSRVGERIQSIVPRKCYLRFYANVSPNSLYRRQSCNCASSDSIPYCFRNLNICTLLSPQCPCYGQLVIQSAAPYMSINGTVIRGWSSADLTPSKNHLRKQSKCLPRQEDMRRISLWAS